MIHVQPLPPDTDLLAMHRSAPGRYRVLLESAATPLGAGAGAGDERLPARWDMLLACSGEALRLEADGRTRQLRPGVEDRPLEGRFLDALDAAWRAERLPRGEASLPFRGGWALFLAYELAAQIEPVLDLPAAVGAAPVALALRCPAAVLRDRASGRVLAVVEADAADARGQLAGLRRDALASRQAPPPASWQPPREVDEAPPAHYLQGVRAVLDYLAAGDVFQVNLSRAWRARFAAPPAAADFYARLRAANPAPFAGLLAEPDWALVSSSPERLVSVCGDRVQTRPIAGTRARLPGDDEQARLRELVGHPKERAEHVMLIDLERNDLGRVCRPGSVEVDELMGVESYAHVHHIVSNVRGLLREGVTPGQTIAAVFPGGTITGCPKVRCMQIVAGLEATGRGAYTGALGWLNRDGDLDLNILIRSASLQGDTLTFRTGAGIVVDSDPAGELAETRAKARGLLRALGIDGA